MWVLHIVDIKADAPEVGLEGWQDLEQAYSFAYVKSEGKDLATANARINHGLAHPLITLPAVAEWKQS